MKDRQYVLNVGLVCGGILLALYLGGADATSVLVIGGICAIGIFMELG